MATSTSGTFVQLVKLSIVELHTDSTRIRPSVCVPDGFSKKENLFPTLRLGKCRNSKLVQLYKKPFRVTAMASGGNKFYENDPHFVDAAVIEAVEVQSGAAGFVLRMRNGKMLKCNHNDSIGARLLHCPSQPAMVLKMLDDSNLLLPIVVGESSRSMLSQSLHDETTSRPTVYAVMLDMMEKMGYEPQLVRITHRAKENYVGRLYLTMAGNCNALLSIDIRPSDAINVAARAQIPIQVAKSLVFSDGLKVVGNDLPFSFSVTNVSESASSKNTTQVDAVNVSKEFNLVSSMELAIVEERYDDAAKIRDELNKFRRASKERKVSVQISLFKFKYHLHLHLLNPVWRLLDKVRASTFSPEYENNQVVNVWKPFEDYR